MRKALVILLVVVLAAAVLDALRDRTENRFDEAVAGSRSVVTFDVDTYDAPQAIGESARALWYACNQTIANQLVELRIGDGGNGVATVSPALGPHERKRLTGCLKDATIDRVRGDVLGIVDLPAASPSPAVNCEWWRRMSAARAHSSRRQSTVQMPAGGVKDPAGRDDERVGVLGAIPLCNRILKRPAPRRRPDGEVAQRRLHARRLAGGHEVRRRHAPGASHTGAAVQEHRAAGWGTRRRNSSIWPGSASGRRDRQRDHPQPNDRSVASSIDRSGSARRSTTVVTPAAATTGTPPGCRRRAAPHLGVDGGEVATSCTDAAAAGAGGPAKCWSTSDGTRIPRFPTTMNSTKPTRRAAQTNSRSPAAGGWFRERSDHECRCGDRRAYRRRRGQGQRVRARRRGARQLAATRWMA